MGGSYYFGTKVLLGVRVFEIYAWASEY